MDTQEQFTIPRLGEAKVSSPIKMSLVDGDKIANYVKDDEAILYDIDIRKQDLQEAAWKPRQMEKAGPREKIYFSPSHVHAGIVTCGGLCPGINDVIRSIVRTLWYRYGVKRITGIPNGFKGLLPEYGFSPIELDPDIVDDIHKVGGTILGTSRGGGERTGELTDTIERMNLNILFVIGGDGTQKGALKIASEVLRRGLRISVIGIPKTIDNDLAFLQKSFGFETAVGRATEAVAGAHTEAHSTINGVGLVKLMGRDSGFIAAHTALAVNEANFVLIPEVPFDLDGSNGLLVHLEKRLAERGHALIIVAEGAGQEHLPPTHMTDRSGNKVYNDIGPFLKDRINAYFTEKNIEVNLKYIDPSYIIRSSRADATDAYYCSRLGSHAVHAAMAGRTGMLVSLVNTYYVHLPIETVISRRHTVDPEGSLWRDVVEATRQPVLMKNR
ncbi:MAG: ATP-dependent 6-phosphofructokinase [Spirochaetales bacterium]|nr:ATP-dependent 6-phosphofructokinase [Spirochaetales bacterium]